MSASKSPWFIDAEASDGLDADVRREKEIKEVEMKEAVSRHLREWYHMKRALVGQKLIFDSAHPDYDPCLADI